MEKERRISTTEKFIACLLITVFSWGVWQLCYDISIHECNFFEFMYKFVCLFGAFPFTTGTLDLYINLCDLFGALNS